MPGKSGNYVLFHTDVCHLCEQAAELLDLACVEYQKQDICDHESLAEQYGKRIPVLMQLDSKNELNWPFDMDTLKAFLGA